MTKEFHASRQKIRASADDLSSLFLLTRKSLFVEWRPWMLILTVPSVPAAARSRIDSGLLHLGLIMHRTIGLTGYIGPLNPNSFVCYPDNPTAHLRPKSITQHVSGNCPVDGKSCQLATDLLATWPTSWQQVVVMEFGKRHDIRDTTDFFLAPTCYGLATGKRV